MKVPLTRPDVGELEEKLVVEVIRSGWLTQGPRVTEFEQALARTLDVPFAVAFSNCTTALHVALLLHGVGPGDEVIVPSYTFIATANAVRMVGATPVFADIEPETFDVSAKTIEPLLSENTKLIMPVHQFGMPADIDPISALGKEYGLPVVEDAACAMGSRYKGRPVGSSGNVACFSFHPRKVVTTGEGGLLVTTNERFMKKARELVNHGASISDIAKHQANTVEALLGEDYETVGYNYRLSNLQGALGLAQLTRLESGLSARRARARRYQLALSSCRHVSIPHVPEYATPNWQSYAVRVLASSPRSRNEVAQRLLDAGIACRPAYMACHDKTVYRREGLRLPHTDQALREVLILPLFPQMTDAEQDYVVAQLVAAVA